MFTLVITQDWNSPSDNVIQLVPKQAKGPHHPSPPPISSTVKCKSLPHPLKITKEVNVTYQHQSSNISGIYTELKKKLTCSDIYNSE